MGDKSVRVNTTSKIRICDAALTGLLRRDLRLVGYWLVANQSHQIEYHRQKIHSIKTRIGGDAALEELLQCVSALATTTDEGQTDQHGSKPAEKIAPTVNSESLISSDWINAFNGAPCVDNLTPQPGGLPRARMPVHMEYVAQQLSTQLSAMHQTEPPLTVTIPRSPRPAPPPPLRYQESSSIVPANTASQNSLPSSSHNVIDMMPDLYLNYDQILLNPQKSGGGVSDTSFASTTCPERSSAPGPGSYCIDTSSSGRSHHHAHVEQIRPENLEMLQDADLKKHRRWTTESAIYAVERFRGKALSKDHHDLLSYVLNLGAEMERKCLDVMESCRIWNNWADEHLPLIPKRNDKPFTFRPTQMIPEYAGWRIHLEDRPRQRYTKRTVQKWMTYMSGSSMGSWHSGITARNFREALDNGGLFCTIGTARQEDLTYNILGGRRNHVTKVEALNIRCGQYEKEYEFKRYDTDLILPECIIKNPLPRVVVFECQELNLRAVMFIIRLQTEKTTPAAPRRTAKRTKKFDTLLAGELQLDQNDQSFSATCPELSTSSIPSSEGVIALGDDPRVGSAEMACTTFETEPDDTTTPIEDAPIPRLKVEQVDESELYCVTRYINNTEDPPPPPPPSPPEDAPSKVPEGVSEDPDIVTPQRWTSQDVSAKLDAEHIPSLAGWPGGDVAWPLPNQTRPLENCWFGEGGNMSTTELSGIQHLASHNAFEDAIFAASAAQQQIKRCRTSQLQY